MDILSQIRQFIRENLLFSSEGEDLADTTSFLETGVVDSTGILEIVQFIEETFSISVDDEELIPENLDSMKNLSEFVTRKLSPGKQEKVAL
jgi:acyl carrier protein